MEKEEREGGDTDNKRVPSGQFYMENSRLCDNQWLRVKDTFPEDI